MKILHICPTFTEGLTYQENYLTKYHKKLGYTVTVITSYWVYDSNGKLIEKKEKSYINKNGVKIIRLPLKDNRDYYFKFKKFDNLTKTIVEEQPDIFFIHGCQWIYIKELVEYIKRNKTIVYVDNHADYSNSATTWTSKYILHRLVWKHYAKMIEPYTRKFYGVLPARVDFLKDLYGLPEKKCELLVMGADDDQVEKAGKIENVNEIRQKYKIEASDFLIVTGGKIDAAKQQTLLLMKAINNLSENHIKLLVFGSITQELKKKFYDLCNENIIYVGWQTASDTYNIIAAADLVIYPGRHSVLWEQTVAQGKPMIVKYWNGINHLDMGGNIKFLYKDDLDEIQDLLKSIVNTPQYIQMLIKANQKEKEKFLYSRIAEKSLT